MFATTTVLCWDLKIDKPSAVMTRYTLKHRLPVPAAHRSTFHHTYLGR